MEKINVAELLKDCPKGMELYSPLCGGCKLYSVNDYNITIEIPNRDSLIILRHDGTYCANGEIMLFPKGKTTWEGFVPPCEFKDGDIIFTHANCLKVGVGNTWISIFQEKRNSGVATYVDYAEDGSDIYLYNEDKALLCMEKDILRQRLATEEEKEKLFQAIKDEGYKWDVENKALVKLIKPKFKVGDRIVHKVNKESPFTITEITNDCYKGGTQYAVLIEQQDNFELVPTKFDINSLIPFESRVLIRDYEENIWIPAFWGCILDRKQMRYLTTRGAYHFCIPYEGNEHLLGKTDKCHDFYKIWE